MGTADRFFWLTLRRLWPRWKEVLAAMDFFTVPTANFRVLYVVFVVHHARRTVLLARVTE